MSVAFHAYLVICSDVPFIVSVLREMLLEFLRFSTGSEVMVVGATYGNTAHSTFPLIANRIDVLVESSVVLVAEVCVTTFNVLKKQHIVSIA